MNYDQAKVATAKKQIDDNIRTKYSPKHGSVDAEADQMLGLTKAGENLKSGAKPQHKVGDTVTYQGKPYKVKAIRQDGKLELGQ